jgi:hypothetical protein
MLFGYLSFGQTINGIEVKDLNCNTLKVSLSTKGFTKGYMVTLDYGQELSRYVAKDDKKCSLVDEKGKTFRFNSDTAVVDFFIKNGYTLLSESVWTVAGIEFPSYKFSKNK